MRLSILGKDSKTKDDKPLGVVDVYVKENTTELVDPLDVKKKLEALEENQNQAIAYNRINKRIKQYYNVESGIRCISVICTNGKSVVYDVKTDSAVDNLWRNFSDLRMTTPYRNTEGEPGMVLTPTMVFKENESYSHYMHISKRIFDLNDLEKGSIATIVISIDAEEINELCNPSEENGKIGFNFILSEEGTIVSYPDDTYVGRMLEQKETIEDFVKRTGVFGSENIAVNVCEDIRTDWRFCNIYNKDYILQNVRRVQMISVILGIITMGMATIAILLLTRQLNRSVKSIVEGMQRVQEGNLETEVPVQYHDEIGRIAGSFNVSAIKPSLKLIISTHITAISMLSRGSHLR